MLSTVRLALRSPTRPASLVLGSARYASAKSDPPEGQEPPLSTPSEREYRSTASTTAPPPRGQEPPLAEPAFQPQAHARHEMPLPPPPGPTGKPARPFLILGLIVAVVGAIGILPEKSREKEHAKMQEIITTGEIQGALEKNRIVGERLANDGQTRTVLVVNDDEKRKV